MEPIIAAGAYTGTAEKDRVKYDIGEGDVPPPIRPIGTGNEIKEQYAKVSLLL